MSIFVLFAKISTPSLKKLKDPMYPINEPSLKDHGKSKCVSKEKAPFEIQASKIHTESKVNVIRHDSQPFVCKTLHLSICILKLFNVMSELVLHEHVIPLENLKCISLDMGI